MIIQKENGKKEFFIFSTWVGNSVHIAEVWAGP